MKKLNELNKETFYLLERTLIKNGNGSDNSSFQEIKNKLNKSFILSSETFAKEIIYAIMTSGFNQVTAKRFYTKIIDYLDSEKNPKYNDLIQIFRNKTKIDSILKIWNNKEEIRSNFYNLKTDDEKINFLSKLPYIGSITKYHIARNLGINCYKPDRWIIKLYCVLSKTKENWEELYKLFEKKNNKELYNKCLKFFENEFKEILQTEKIGYIDVVLFKSSQQKLLKIDIENNELFLNVD